MEGSLTILWKTYKEREDNFYRDRLISKYIPFLKGIVSRVYAKLPKTMDIMDLENYAYLGLIDAIKKFDLNRKIKFETYATYRIKGAIIDGVRKQDWLSRSQRSRIKNNCENQFEDPSENNLQDNEVRNYFRDWENDKFVMLSTDDPDFYEKKIANSSISGDSIDGLYLAATADFAEKVQNKLSLRKAICKLTAQERKIIFLYYFKGKNFKEIGQSMHVTESRVSQINKKMLLILKKELNCPAIVSA
ncbi:MAG: sigma-70 family RNA polymerase sigma factor [Actinobacteria bacterium]|nr:sigma-70 family RNA polymerase sigma factor [Actinomycetota bacterium]